MRFYFLLGIVFFILTGTACSSKKTTEEQTGVSVQNKPCDSLSYYVDMYFKNKDTIMENRYGKQVIPIDTAFGNSYIEAYLREAGKDATEGVILDIQTIAMFYDYLARNPGKKIGVSLARYNKKYWNIGRNIKDPTFNNHPNTNPPNRIALVFGIYDSKKGFLPFEDGTRGVFYDDWNQEWP